MQAGRPARAGWAGLSAIALMCCAGSAWASEEAAPAATADQVKQVEGAWIHTGQDCDTDNHFDPPAGMPGAKLTLARDYSYSLTMSGRTSRGTFTLAPHEDFGGDHFLVVLEEAGLTFVLNIDRLESWNGNEGVTQCTQLFERPA
jgi:hypothetical protein